MANLESAPIMDRTKFLDFEKVKTQDITFEQLINSVEENDVNTGAPMKGMYHYQFIQSVLDMCNELGYETEMYDLFAAQNKNGSTPGVSLLPYIEQKEGERAVKAHLLRRVFANVRIKNFDTGEGDNLMTTNLSIAYHQRGVQVGFGNNVWICHNQTMLHADLYASTYSENGSERMELQQMLGLVKSWLVDARHIVEEDRERLERMKQVNVSAEQMYVLIGMLTALRVAHDSRDKSIHINKTYPLSQTQICSFTEDMMIRYKRFDKVTVYDLYDGATNLYKANMMDIPQVLPQNLAMVRLLEEQFDF